MSERILLRFANEEIIYLLRSLRITNFPGIAPEPLKELTDDKKALLMTEADHALRARGLVHWRGETEREIAPLPGKMLRECARPRYTVFVDRLDVGKPAAQLLYLIGQEMIVEQCEPEPQVQQYLVLFSQTDFLQRLQALTVPEQVGISEALPGGRLHSTLWREAFKAARIDEARTGTLLTASLPRPTANALAASLHDFQYVRYLARWPQVPTDKQRSPEAELTIVMGRNRLFLLESEKRDSSTLNLVSATMQQAQESVTRLALPENTPSSLNN